MGDRARERALSELFGQVLGLCADAGMVRVGVVAVDGTKVHANASRNENLDYEQLAEHAVLQKMLVTEPDRLVTRSEYDTDGRVHTIVAPGSEKPCSGPTTWTIPCWLALSSK